MSIPIHATTPRNLIVIQGKMMEEIIKSPENGGKNRTMIFAIFPRRVVGIDCTSGQLKTTSVEDGRPACLGRRASSLSFRGRTGGTRCLPSQAGSLFSNRSSKFPATRATGRDFFRK
jgi:hypothetical protein